MDLGLKNKIIVVSDGAKGINEGIVRVLAAENAVPVILAQNENDNLNLVNEVTSAGGKCFQIVTELTKPEACQSSVQKIIKEFGEIHGLVNNADVNDGIGLEHGNYDAFIASLHKNIIHYYLLTHYALPALKRTKGSIVNISSKVAYYITGAKKALTREWAVDLLNYGIRVNAVIVAESRSSDEKSVNALSDSQKKLQQPNQKTTLENRMTTTEEIANTVAFLLSEKSSHTTGQLIHAKLGDMPK